VGEDFFVSLVEVDVGLLVHDVSFALRNRDQWTLAEFFKSAHCTIAVSHYDFVPSTPLAARLPPDLIRG
jgi:hypothetical protein